MQAKEFIGLDLGDKRSGIARGSTIAKIAQPLKTVDTSSLETELQQLLSANSVAGIVVGLPRNMQGEETEQTKRVREWVEQARVNFEVPFIFQDESLTSRLAEENGADKSNVDARAAALILQDYLEKYVEEPANV